MDPIQVDFSGGGNSKKGKGSGSYAVPKKAGLKVILSLLITLVGGFITYYFMLPSLNFKSTDLYIFVGALVVIFTAANALLSGIITNPQYTDYVKKKSKIPAIIIIVIAAVVIVGYVVSSTVFRASSYSKIIAVDESKSFASDIEETDFKSVPVLDNSAAAALANRSLGDLAKINKVSQFELSNDFTQINYKNSPVRVTTLAYGDIFKWFKNTKTGLPGYIVVDMVTQKAELVMLEEGKYMRYSTQEHFSKYLMRHVQFKYPTYIFDQPHFEIDEAGNPYWICPVLDRTIGLFGGTDVKGAVLVNAVTGETKEVSIDEIKNDASLQWIDVVYSNNLLVEQYNYYGRLSGGFINSIIGQEGVKLATEGSNFLAMNDDVYMYTGVTSANSDQAIIGFVLVNMRTKDANFYTVSGAKEYSAAASAEGAVQNYQYTSTFPILLNISGQPTYFMSLKDTSNLVKRYAMVNVQNYQVVVTGETIAKCTESYAQQLKQNNIKIDVDIDSIEQDTNNQTPNVDNNEPTVKYEKTKGKITDIRSAVMGGESVYFIKLDSVKPYFKVTASDFPNIVISNVGDVVTVEYEKSDKDIIDAVSVK